MAQRLSAYAKNLGSVPSTHMAAHPRLFQGIWHPHRHAGKAPMHIEKVADDALGF